MAKQKAKPTKHKHQWGGWKLMATGVKAKYCKCGAMLVESL